MNKGNLDTVSCLLSAGRVFQQLCHPLTVPATIPTGGQLKKKRARRLLLSQSGPSPHPGRCSSSALRRNCHPGCRAGCPN